MYEVYVYIENKKSLLQRILELIVSLRKDVDDEIVNFKQFS